MYLHRRGAHWWIRKAVPVDLVEILGIAVVRRSRRTKDPALARRRALQLLIRVDDVYAVLRSKRPLRPTREVALALLDKALDAHRGMALSFDRKAEMLKEAQEAIFSSLSDTEDSSDDPEGRESYCDPANMVSSDDALLPSSGSLSFSAW